MSLVFAVERALSEERSFDTQQNRRCASFDVLLGYCPDLFHEVDDQLFDGELARFFEAENIRFSIVASDSGPAGLTTYNDNTHPAEMTVALRRDAWQTSFPAFVGGNLCHAADACLIDIFLHELVHVVLFSIYVQLDLSAKDVERLIPYHYDTTHNILFTVWISRFFGQDTIHNSLLLCGTDEPLTFHRSLKETEVVCVHDNTRKTLMMFRNGRKEPVELLTSNTHKKNDNQALKPHHSRVRTRSGTILHVPNGILFC